MNYIDIIVACVLLFLGVKGFMKGFVIELASIVALILGIWGAIKFSVFAEGFLGEETNIDRDYLPLTAFAVTFLGIVIGVHIAARILQRVLKLTALGFANRVAGAGFGVLKGVLILSFIFVFINSAGGDQFSLISTKTRTKSMTYPYISALGPAVLPVITKSDWYKELELIEENIDLPFLNDDAEMRPGSDRKNDG